MREAAGRFRENPFTKREIGLDLLRRLAVLVAIGLALGWMGPFGTYGLPLERRLLYWVLNVPLVGLCASLTIRLAARSSLTAHWPLGARVILGAVLAGFPATFIILGLDELVSRRRTLDLHELVEMLITISLCIALIGYPLARLSAARRMAAIVAAPPEPPAESPFLRRIPPRLGTGLLSLSAEDHYVRVTTHAGSDLVLCRLSDAVAELAPGLGERVHRSWWVAKAAVASVERQNGKISLALVNGETVPVSQSYVPALKSAGWL